MDYEVWIELDEDFKPPFNGNEIKKTTCCEDGELYYTTPRFPGGSDIYEKVDKLKKISKYEVGPIHNYQNYIFYGYVLVPKREILNILKYCIKQCKIFNNAIYNLELAEKLYEYVESFPDNKKYKLVNFIWG